MEERKPIQPFKTISLVDRLKGTIYDRDFEGTPKQKDPQGSPEVNSIPKQKDPQGSPEINTIPKENKPQGSPEINTIPTSQNKNSDEINLPKSQLNTSKEGASLKELPPLPQKESLILKTLLDSPQANLPTPLPIKYRSLESFDIPRARTQFASNISLADRLAQPNGAKTTHLAQYFLSDLYTGYLEISPLLTAAIDDTQNVTTTEEPIGENQILRIQNPDTLITDRIGDGIILLAQGTIFNNGAFESLTDPADRIEDTSMLQLQGTFLTNNQYISFTETTPPIVVVNQGSIELPIWNPVTEQGVTTEDQQPLGDLSIAVLQGMIEENGLIKGSVVDREEFQTITLENVPVPTLDILSYETDRLLAFSTPKVKHGSADIEVTRFDADALEAIQNPLIKHGTIELAVQQFLENRTEAVNDPIQFHGTSVVNQVQFDPNDKPAQTPAVDSTSAPGDKNNESPPDIGDVGGDQYNNGNPGGDGVLRNTNPGSLPSLNNTGYVGSLGYYDSLFYGSLAGKAFQEKIEGDIEFGQKNQGYSGTFEPIKSKGGVIPGAQSGKFNDFVTIKFVKDGKFLQLKSYLTSFSDGFTANWNDVQYVGRQDTLKQFTGVTRAVSFAVLLPSFSKGDIDKNMRKLNALAGMTVVGGFASGAKYITGPLCKLKIGNLIDAHCAFSSLKWDFDPAEATFDIDEEMPHMLKVSLEAAVLADSDDKLLNGAGVGNYFGKKY
jgi:hypothetical protein|tara:strand:+ start:677 stop:2848 length:2172 start_codon:yes stop_codon:yes gene_type:complete